MRHGLPLVFSNSLLIQWQRNTHKGTVTITLPIAFNNTTYYIVSSYETNAADEGSVVKLAASGGFNKTNNSFKSRFSAGSDTYTKVFISVGF